MNGVVVLCDDLFFSSKVTATGRAQNVPVAVARTAEAALRVSSSRPTGCLVIDLHNPGLDLPKLIADLRAKFQPAPRTIGFGSHVDVETLKAARKAGCDLVLPRSQFTEQLEVKLAEWAGSVTNSESRGSEPTA